MSITKTLTNKLAECSEMDFSPFDGLFNEMNDQTKQPLDKDRSTSKCIKRKSSAASSTAHEMTAEEQEYHKLRQLLPFEEAAPHLKHNPYIRTGYRKFLPTILCWESIFWWTNETINIWSHVFGWFLFLGLTINDLMLLNIHASFIDKVVVGVLLSCFQVCMISSSLYHTFSCRSEDTYNCFLMYDLFGIALSLLAIYTSGVYYAFWCHETLRWFYLISVTLIFAVAMLVQLPRYKINANVKMLIFVAWAAYGVVPTLHWAVAMGGFDNPMVQLLFPRVIGMYLISGIAFIIYLLKVPERWCAGKFDFIGHSHQWWHLFVVLALYYWHNSGMIYVQYRMNHGCANTMRIF
ncbi:progestin and adipoQ receptor family member 3 [Arctopsyche grandis]|uniref:progestin and adipoQ receptor family member 3 n=1 Tax=Arctopsyche grandis TaxID=121162 RepID=UPI00406D9A81